MFAKCVSNACASDKENVSRMIWISWGEIAVNKSANDAHLHWPAGCRLSAARCVFVDGSLLVRLAVASDYLRTLCTIAQIHKTPVALSSVGRRRRRRRREVRSSGTATPIQTRSQCEVCGCFNRQQRWPAVATALRKPSSNRRLSSVVRRR